MLESGNAAIRFNRVHYSVDKMPILINITGSFPAGKITTIVGPSGAGKSTLFKLCNGLKTANAGEIFIKDKPIETYPPVELRRYVGIALQNATMLPGSVLENLELPLKLQGKQLDKQIATELLIDVGLDKEILSRDTKDLSGGQRQKISIARTLINRPEVLLLDEITSSLDRISQHEIEELIKKINKKYGVTIIWITHNLKQAHTIGDYTWVMINGELVEFGESNLLHTPKNEKVKQFIQGDFE